MHKKTTIFCVAALLLIAVCLIFVSDFGKEDRNAGVIFVKETKYAENRI